MTDPNLSTPENEVASSTSKVQSAIAAVSLGNVLSIALRFWYWIVLSVIICVSIAVLSVKRTVPLYTRICAVIIRDDATSAVGSTSVDLSEIGVGISRSVLTDEMATLKSPDLMEQVVKKLRLTVNYATPGMFHNNVLYGSNLPVTVDFPDIPDDETASLTVNVDEAGKLRVTDLVVNKKPMALPADGAMDFGSVIATPSGRIIVSKTPFFREGTPYTVNVNRTTLEAATKRFEGEISVDQANKKSYVVEISCLDASIQRGDEILTSLVNAYNQDWIKGRAEVVAITSNFITDRLNVLESELGSVDTEISSFKSSNLIPDLGQASSMYMQQSNSSSNQIMQLSNQLQMARYLRTFINTEGRNNTVLPVNTGIGSSNIESQIAEYNSLMIQRNTHLSNTSVNNPLIVDLDSRLAALRSSILSSLDNQIMALTNNIGSLERNEQTANARVAANPRQAKFLLTAERQQKVKESLYLYLLQKREESELSQAFTSVNTRLIRKPTGSNGPTFPKSSQTYMMGFIIGLMIPFCLIYLIEILNTRLRGRKDIEDTNLPIIGEIPEFQHENAKLRHRFISPSKMRDELPVEDDVIVEEGSRDLVNEAFRVLRTNISFITAESIPCVAMFTSFNAGSGKTFITLNSGISLALKGKKVLCIDGDLRRGSLSRVVKSPKHGIAEYLNGSTRDVNSLIIKGSLTPNLSILPVGTFPPNPTELLESPRFNNLIDYLRTEYDYIFIDCPPVEMMADAQIINNVVDRTFIVLRVGLFERSMIPELERIYQSKKYRNIAIIINGADTKSRYGSYYRYGYGYTRKNYKDYKGYNQSLSKGKKK
ncbi:MAG: polysaccharide biosynthesis tyrosine autokinase [Muribaculaceae bacterium]|nr:polysaccharide biosynthesis tyrosine autokinase [Muribaculaceae bacterium]